MYLFLLINNKMGGAENVMFQLVQYYLGLNKKVTVIFFCKRSKSNWGNLENNINLTMKYLSLFSFIFFLKAKTFEKVYTTHIYLNSLAGFLRKLKLLKANFLIGRESTNLFTRYKGLKLLRYKILYRIGYTKLNLLICQSDIMLKDFKFNLPSIYKSINVVKINNPFTYPKNRYCPTEFSDKEYIVSAGRLIEEKGFDILIKSFNNIKNHFPNLVLVILGEGQKRKELEELISDYNLENRVFLKGFVTNVYDYFYESILCVVSSRVEGFPNVLLQMMSQNQKVISTNCAGGIKDLKGVNVVNVEDVNSLSEAIQNHILNDDVVNRKFFDKELENRSVNSFIKLVEYHLYV